MKSTRLGSPASGSWSPSRRVRCALRSPNRCRRRIASAGAVAAACSMTPDFLRRPRPRLVSKNADDTGGPIVARARQRRDHVGRYPQGFCVRRRSGRNSSRVANGERLTGFEHGRTGGRPDERARVAVQQCRRCAPPEKAAAVVANEHDRDRGDTEYGRRPIGDSFQIRSQRPVERGISARHGRAVELVRLPGLCRRNGCDRRDGCGRSANHRLAGTGLGLVRLRAPRRARGGAARVLGNTITRRLRGRPTRPLSVRCAVVWRGVHVRTRTVGAGVTAQGGGATNGGSGGGRGAPAPDPPLALPQSLTVTFLISS